MKAVVLGILFLLVGRIHSAYLPFWDDFSDKDDGLKVIMCELKLRQNLKSPLSKSKIEIQFLSRGDYNITEALMLFDFTEDISGRKFEIPIQMAGHFDIVSNDDDGDVSTLNKGGIYANIKYDPLIASLPAGKYTIRVQSVLDTNGNPSVISDFKFSYKIK